MPDKYKETNCSSVKILFNGQHFLVGTKRLCKLQVEWTKILVQFDGLFVNKTKIYYKTGKLTRSVRRTTARLQRWKLLIGCDGSGRNSVKGANQPPYSGMGRGCKCCSLDGPTMDMAIAAELFSVAEVLMEVCRADEVEAARAEVVMAGGWTLNSRSLVWK